MIEPTLMYELMDALKQYRQAVNHVADAEAKGDYLRLAATVDRLILALRNDDLKEAKLGILSFSRQVSDAYSEPLPEYMPLSLIVARLRKTLA